MVSGLMETPPVLSPVISGPAGIRFGVCLQTRYFGLWGGGLSCQGIRVEQMAGDSRISTLHSGNLA